MAAEIARLKASIQSLAHDFNRRTQANEAEMDAAAVREVDLLQEVRRLKKITEAESVKRRKVALSSAVEVPLADGAEGSVEESR